MISILFRTPPKKNLAQSTIQGGSGMGFENGQYPTQICPYEHFKDLN